MLIRNIRPEEKDQFDKLAGHPLQSWEWGEFRRSLGQSVERFGVFSDAGELQETWQVLFSDLPISSYKVGYVPRGPQPRPEVFQALQDLGKNQKAIFIKLEPNIFAPADDPTPFPELKALLEQHNARPGQPLFTPYTFQLDLTPSEEEIFANIKSKTRYNIRLARKKGVQIVEDTSSQGLQDYVTLLSETTSRQGFYAHNQKYYQQMFDTFADSKYLRILKAVYEGQVISVWILFIHQQTGYYPYGASSRQHKDVMANNLMMWEALMLAKKEGCTKFDMWGSLGPQFDPNHKWAGFHRFKEGYGANLMQSLGSFDVVTNFPLYSLFTFANQWRWKFLHAKAKLGL